MSWSAKQSITKRLLVTVLGLLCIHVCCVTGMEVEQRPPVESVLEGASPTLQCNFSTSATSVQWFRQDPGGHLVHLFYIPSGTKHNGRLNSTTVTKERRSSLYIFSSQTTDSAIYFCAVEPHCSADTCCLPQPSNCMAYYSLVELEPLLGPADLGLWSLSSLLNLVSLFLHYKPLIWNMKSN
ncbi:unnamed protein product [Nyctereutes procyonoides]|uniref:(raccoon dog) hypothetical protein n=1 Tax=Nyctereutes procyonoides TaxID=34880 RepID=A0A811ZSF4_NYCPR|nr:unnamed protein product [Nyctereutes procyonoides]